MGRSTKVTQKKKLVEKYNKTFILKLTKTTHRQNSNYQTKTEFRD